MALNPHFLQGSQGEQRLVQDLINEHLKIYGVEVTYIPRKFVRQQTIIREVQSSVFDDNFLLEAYVNTFDGYGGQGDLMTKFGVSLRDELTVTISKERFEDFISPFLAADDDYTLSSRPREGDIIFFPLGQRLFEVKFVEHEQPFYQLGKNYVYQLKCELFEYEDEVLDTGIDVIDSQLEDVGYISKLQLIGAGTTATATAIVDTGNAKLSSIRPVNPGVGYTVAPTVTIADQNLIIGRGNYLYNDLVVGQTSHTEAIVREWDADTKVLKVANVGIGSTISGFIPGEEVRIQTGVDPGTGHKIHKTVFVSTGTTTGFVGIHTNLITGINTTGITVGAAVSAIDNVIGLGATVLTIGNSRITISKDSITTSGATFTLSTGTTSFVAYNVRQYEQEDIYDAYSDNDEFELEADEIVDFAETNPFGTY